MKSEQSKKPINRQSTFNKPRELYKRGFDLNEDGGIKYCNGNRYAHYIHTERMLVIYKNGVFREYVDGVYKLISDDEMKQRLRNILHEPMKDTWTLGYENFYLAALQRETAYIGELNPRKKYLNTLNGMLSLKDYSLKPHSPKYYSTVQIPCRYDKNATCPEFIKFMKSVFANDESRIALAQEWLGYLLTAEVRAHKALILYGTGGNGKGTFTSIIEQLVGKDNISCVSIEGLSRAFTRATIHGKSLILSNENEFGKKGINTEYFKMIVSGDMIQAEHKNKPPFEFKPIAKFCLSMNRLPYSLDRTDGYFRRLSLLHFSETFSIDKGTADVNLADKLTSELSGILNWALEGLERLRTNNYRFTNSKSSRLLLKKYKLDINPVMEFISECIKYKGVSSQTRTGNMDIYRAFQTWARKTGHKQSAEMSTRRFWNEMDAAMVQLKHKPIERRRSNTYRYCVGIELIQKNQKDDDCNGLFDLDKD